jgi:hypothetical protein
LTTHPSYRGTCCIIALTKQNKPTTTSTVVFAFVIVIVIVIVW